jgi:Cellulase (glycosyl hydrolase family 5)
MPMKKIYFLVAVITTHLFIAQSLCAQTTPLALHPKNPHYFVFHNKPTVLISSGEHYGAVMNTGFDYITYLNTLASDGLNVTRTFSGCYHEPGDAFNISHNSMAPEPDKFICPWARSKEPGFKEGGNKFDLEKWDENYFARLKKFVAAAQQRNIIVEFTFFCPFYEESQWLLSPMNSINNINGLGNIARTDVYTMHKNGALLTVQEKMVRKIVDELKDFDNIMYEICNEPYFGGVALEWQQHIASVISKTEINFLSKHLITQNIANGHSEIEKPFNEVSVFNFHYAMPPVTVALNYDLNKVIGDNETGFRGNSDSAYRMEAWRFILAGGSLYNNLDYSFAVGHEKGDYKYPATQPGGGSIALRKQLSYLKHFIESFNFINMRPDSVTITGGVPANALFQTLSEPGKQYAIYLYRGTQVNLELTLPAGTYQLEWLNTLSGKYSGKTLFKPKSGKAVIVSPVYAEDIALLVKRK